MQATNVLGPILLDLVNLALFIAFVAAGARILRTLAELRRNQRILSEDLDRIADHLGVPPRLQSMIRCPRCASLYL